MITTDIIVQISQEATVYTVLMVFTVVWDKYSNNAFLDAEKREYIWKTVRTGKLRTHVEDK